MTTPQIPAVTEIDSLGKMDGSPESPARDGQDVTRTGAASAGAAEAALAELTRILAQGLVGRTHDVWQRAYTAGLKDARNLLVEHIAKAEGRE